MDHFIIDMTGYAAAVITNISVYPQAYKVYRILTNSNYEKLNSISLYMYLLQTFGCILWLLYAMMTNLYPVMFGSIMCLIPSGYIIVILTCYQNQNLVDTTADQISQIRNIVEDIDITPRNDSYEDILTDNRTDDTTTIVIASGCSFQETSVGEL